MLPRENDLPVLPVTSWQGPGVIVAMYYVAMVDGMIPMLRCLKHNVIETNILPL